MAVAVKLLMYILEKVQSGAQENSDTAETLKSWKQDSSKNPNKPPNLYLVTHLYLGLDRRG